ncbi:MAG: peptidylprolyl isomerase [Candidatus Binatia bacterium]
MTATEPTPPPKVKDTASALPWAAILVGVALVVAGLSRYLPAGLGDDEAARVEATSISMDDWRRAVDAANAGRKVAMDEAGELALLDVLIDQELLLQLADRLQLTRSLPVVRGQLVQAAMEALSQPGLQAEPDEDTLRAFVAADPSLFAIPEQRRVRGWRHDSREAAAAGRGGEPLEIPSTPLSLRHLQRWLGETLAGRVFALPSPALRAEPLAVGQGWYRLEVLDVVPGRKPAFEELDPDLLRREWERHRGEAALAEGLATLREEAGVQARGRQ